MAPMRFGAVVGATMKTVSSEADRSQLATGSASSIGMSGTITPATPACAASAANRLLVALNRVHVLVAAPAEAHEDAPARTELPRQHAGVMKRVRRLERGHDAFEARAELERGDRVLVCHGDVLDALGVAQERVLRTDAGIVEPGGYRMRGQDLAVAVLQQVRVGAVKHSGPP